MILLLLSLFTLVNAFVFPQNDDSSPRLSIKVSGMESKSGAIQVAVFNSADRFLEHPCHQQAINVVAQDTVKASFRLPPGEYSVAVYHDVNENQELDKNFFGIPDEAYGFSNDIRGSRMGPPTFDDTKIILDKKARTVYIKLR